MQGKLNWRYHKACCVAGHRQLSVSIHFQGDMARKPKRIRLATFFGLILILGVTGAILWQLTWEKPTWWSPVDLNDPNIAIEAEQFEYSLIEKTHKIRPKGELWAIRIHDEHINAWLAERLSAWLTHDQDLHWPENISVPQIRLSEDRITLAVQLRDENNSSRVVSLNLEPQMIDEELLLRIDGISLGRLTLPGRPVGQVASWLNEAAPEGFFDDLRVSQLLDLLLEGKAIQPIQSLSDGRAVRLVDIVCEDGAIVLKCITTLEKETEIGVTQKRSKD